MVTKTVLVKCPSCGHQLTENSGGPDAQNQLTCDACGHRFSLEEFGRAALFDEGRKILEKAKKEISRTIERLNRKLR